MVCMYVYVPIHYKFGPRLLNHEQNTIDRQEGFKYINGILFEQLPGKQAIDFRSFNLIIRESTLNMGSTSGKR
jgi:hypothetical protein